MHRVGENLLQLLRDDSRLEALRIQLVVAGERRIVLITHDADLVDVLQLLVGAELADVELDALVARLDDVARNLHVSVHHKALVGHVRVDPDLALMENRILRDSALPTAEIDVALELPRVGRPNDDPLARVADDRVVAGVGVRVQPHDELEVPLLRVRPALLAHVVARRFREVKTPDGDLPDLSILQIDSEGEKINF